MNANARRIWLTGASSGIGAALAEQLLEQGHRLALSARSLEPLQALAKRYPQQVLVVAGDLSDAAQVRSIGEHIAQVWGALDCAILNAGTCEYVEVSAFEAAMVERVMRANLLSASYCIEAALPLLRLGNRAQLVGVGSSVTFMPLPRAEAYGASKAAMRYLLEALRIDLAGLAGKTITVYGQSEVVQDLIDQIGVSSTDFQRYVRIPKATFTKKMKDKALFAGTAARVYRLSL